MFPGPNWLKKSVSMPETLIMFFLILTGERQVFFSVTSRQFLRLSQHKVSQSATISIGNVMINHCERFLQWYSEKYKVEALTEGVLDIECQMSAF
jgi:hypothetical protein